MYSDLLTAALRESGPVAESVPTDDLVSEARRLHGQLAGGGDGRGEVHAHLADQIAYDVALARLCQRVGVVHDPTAFDVPFRERTRLERALADRGVPVGVMAGPEGLT